MSCQSSGLADRLLEEAEAIASTHARRRNVCARLCILIGLGSGLLLAWEPGQGARRDGALLLATDRQANQVLNPQETELVGRARQATLLDRIHTADQTTLGKQPGSVSLSLSANRPIFPDRALRGRVAAGLVAVASAVAGSVTLPRLAFAQDFMKDILDNEIPPVITPSSDAVKEADIALPEPAQAIVESAGNFFDAVNGDIYDVGIFGHLFADGVFRDFADTVNEAVYVHGLEDEGEAYFAEKFRQKPYVQEVAPWATEMVMYAGESFYSAIRYASEAAVDGGKLPNDKDHVRDFCRSVTDMFVEAAVESEDTDTFTAKFQEGNPEKEEAGGVPAKYSGGAFPGAPDAGLDMPLEGPGQPPPGGMGMMPPYGGGPPGGPFDGGGGPGMGMMPPYGGGPPGGPFHGGGGPGGSPRGYPGGPQGESPYAWQGGGPAYQPGAS